MSQTIQFTNRDGKELGTVTLTDAGALEFSTPWVESRMRARRTMLGDDEKAFRSFDGWSNGYVSSNRIS